MKDIPFEMSEEEIDAYKLRETNQDWENEETNLEFKSDLMKGYELGNKVKNFISNLNFLIFFGIFLLCIIIYNCFFLESMTLYILIILSLLFLIIIYLGKPIEEEIA